MSSPRVFSTQERSFVRQVAERLPEPEREQLLVDLARGVVSKEGDFLAVEIGNYDRPEYAGHSSFPFEGKLTDLTGEPVSILLNTDQNDRLLEIEFVWWASPSGTELDWSTLEIVPANRTKW
jgi:hypothetical protein